MNLPLSAIETVEPATLAEALKDRTAWLVDVREPTEYLNERIPGALLFPLSTLDVAALPKDSGRTLVFHCAGGKRSLEAATRLLAGGASRATHLAGGIAAWTAAGLPVITAAPPSPSRTD